MENNEYLHKLWLEDQIDRKKVQQALTGTDHAQLCLDTFKSDMKRAVEVKHLLLTGELRTAEDFYRAAMLLLHNEVMFEELALGVVLAQQAKKLGHEKGEWLLELVTTRFWNSIK